MILHDAKLPPRKGYIEDQDPITGERYYKKIKQLTGLCRKRIIISSSQNFRVPKANNQKFIITLLAGGEKLSSYIEGSNSKIISGSIFLGRYSKVPITIGQPGEPTSFGDKLAAYEYDEKSKGLTVDGITYGLGETKDHPATQGICIIEYDEPIYE